MNIEIVRARQRLDYVFSLVDQLPAEAEVQSHWARYLCVLVSGFVEKAIRVMYEEYAGAAAAPNVARFVKENLKFFQNPSMGKIVELTRTFNEGWADDLEVFTDGRLKDAVNSIVANRHNIAHGETVGISISRMSDYYRGAIEVVEFLNHQCNGGAVASHGMEGTSR